MTTYNVICENLTWRVACIAKTQLLQDILGSLQRSVPRTLLVQTDNQDEDEEGIRCRCSCGNVTCRADARSSDIFWLCNNICRSVTKTWYASKSKLQTKPCGPRFEDFQPQAQCSHPINRMDR